MSTYKSMNKVSKIYSVGVVIMVIFGSVFFGGRFVLTGTVIAEENHQDNDSNIAVMTTNSSHGNTTDNSTQNDNPMEGFVADIAKGKKLSAKCKACHTFNAGGKNKSGPNLWGVSDRQIASSDGFRYSNALNSKNSMLWDDNNLDAFLTKPRDFAKGTKMAFSGMKKEDDRLNMIAWLKTLR